MTTEARDSYGVRINGVHPRGILPENVVDIGRFDVQLGSGADVGGAILCRDLSIDGEPFEVQGSIMATGSVVVRGREGGGLVAGPSAARGVFHVDCPARSAHRTKLLGDVSADRVRLNGAAVYGSVLGREVELQNCIIFGSVYAAETLTISDTICSTFIGKHIALRGSVILLLDSAIAYDEVSLEGRLYMAFLQPWFEGTDVDTGLIALGRSDRKLLDLERDGQDIEHMTILSCDDRVVDLLPFEDLVRANSSQLEARIERILDSAGNERRERCGALEAELEQLFEARIWDDAPATETSAEQEADARNDTDWTVHAAPRHD